jgi:hypothetical protein
MSTSKYPMSRSDFTQKLFNFADDPLHGYKARMHFELPEVIESNFHSIRGFCEQHQIYFKTNPRHIFSRSDGLHQKSCPHCDFERGFRSNERWSTQRIAALLLEHNLPWGIDTTINPISYEVIKNNNAIALVCLKQCDDGSDCSYHVTHTVRNIQTLANDPNHILCQGPCDSRLKGKSSRQTIDELKQHLVNRNSQWRIAEMGKYRDLSSKVIATHQVSGISILLNGYVIANNEPQCPLTKGVIGKLTLANPDKDAQLIISQFTDGHLRLAKIDFNRFSEKASYQFICNRSGSAFTGNISGIKILKHHGCPVCKAEEVHKEGIERLRNFKEIADSQGLIVRDDIWGGHQHRMHIKCKACDHEFYRLPEDFARLLGCPACKRGVGERAIRKCLSALFHVDVEPHKIVVDKKTFELDGLVTMSDGRQFAMEYHGEQHRDPNHRLWDENCGKESGWIRQQHSDAVKKQWCIDQGMILFVIWHNDFYAVHPNRKLNFVKEELTKLGISSYDDEAVFDFNEVISQSSKKLLKIKKLAQDYDFDMTSDLVDFNTKVGFRCNKSGVEFCLSPRYVLYQGGLEIRREVIDLTCMLAKKD